MSAATNMTPIPGREATLAVSHPSSERATAADLARTSVTYSRDLGLVVTMATIDAPEVEAEALRWTTGARGKPVSADQAEGADLSEYHRTVVCLGAKVLHATAESASAITLAGTVTQLAEKAESAGASLVDGALRASGQVLEVTAKAAQEVTEQTAKIIDSARERFHNDLGVGLTEAMQTVQQDLERLLGSEDGAALSAIKAAINRAMSDAQVAWHGSLTSTLTEVAKTLDVNNPSSPLGALERRVVEQQARQHVELTAKLDRVQEMVASTASVATTAAAVAATQASSPAKGRPYQVAVGAVLEGVATGMAASYLDTSDTVGLVKACKKGDGVIEVPASEAGGPVPRVLVELTTQGHPRNWAQYLELAERNRAAQASLGIVPHKELVPGGDLLAVVGPNRMVIAFDPDQDEPGLLRATVQLLTVQAQRRLAEDRSGDLGLADARLEEARRRLIEMGEIIKSAVAVRNGAGKVVSGLETLHTSLGLVIEQARAALRSPAHAAASAA